MAATINFLFCFQFFLFYHSSLGVEFTCAVSIEFTEAGANDLLQVGLLPKNCYLSIRHSAVVVLTIVPLAYL